MSAWLRPQLWLAEGMAEKLPAGDVFEAAMSLRGEVFRDMPGRKTMRVLLGDRAYFVKQHFGVGWAEIFKNILSGKTPILGAETEWQAIHRLDVLGIPTMTAVGFGSQGLNPAARRSFLLTEDLGDIVSLEDFCCDWVENPPPLRLKRQLLAAVAGIARILHDNGLNHRDFYLCHFCLDARRLAAGEVHLYLLDLHRMGMRPVLAQSDRMKDLAALYFSALDIGLSTRDCLRFLRLYRGRGLKRIAAMERGFWDQVAARAAKLYVKFHGRPPRHIYRL
jgi:heptose I phosphotransferase